MGNAPPPAQPAPEPPVPEAPVQEDLPVDDPPGDNLSQEDLPLPHTKEGDFPSDENPSSSNDSFRTIGQSSPPHSPHPPGHSPDSFPLQRKTLADHSVSTPFQPLVASTPMVPAHTGAIPKTCLLYTSPSPRD